MSVIYCDDCDKTIDTDYDAEGNPDSYTEYDDTGIDPDDTDLL